MPKTEWKTMVQSSYAAFCCHPSLIDAIWKILDCLCDFGFTALAQQPSQRMLWPLKEHFCTCHVESRGAWSSGKSQVSPRRWCQHNLCAWNQT